MHHGDHGAGCWTRSTVVLFLHFADVTSSFGEFPGWIHTDFSLVTATGGPQLRAIYHSIGLVRRILMRPLQTLADAWLVRYPSFSCTESYSHATTTSHTPIDSPRPADSNETLADSIRLLVIELPQLLVSLLGGVPSDFSLVTATGGP